MELVDHAVDFGKFTQILCCF